jgi:hypothetical protein
MPRNPNVSFRITAKPGHCSFSLSTISAWRAVKSGRGLFNSAAAICGEIWRVVS